MYVRIQKEFIIVQARTWAWPIICTASVSCEICPHFISRRMSPDEEKYPVYHG